MRGDPSASLGMTTSNVISNEERNLHHMKQYNKYAIVLRRKII